MSIRTPISRVDMQEKVKTLLPVIKGLDLISDHVVITDTEGNIIYANEAVEKNTGFSQKETIGKNPGDLWGGKMPKEFYEKMWRTIKEEKKPFVGEVNNIKKDGTSYWQELHITPILDYKGGIKFFLGIEPNITDKKNKEQFREEFISIIGHQLRNPLASIKFMLGLLLKESALSEEDKKKIQAIFEQNNDLASFVADLLVLSRAEKLKPDANIDEIDLVEEIRKIIEEVKTHNPSVKFTFSADGSFSLKTNKTFAIQVFSNLIYNAAEYSDKTSGEVKVSLEKSDGKYIFSCHNNGPAIKDEDKPHIFQKLFRSADAIKIKKTGTGLGLFIIKMIADKMGWEIWFKSVEGQGTTFYVKI